MQDVTSFASPIYYGGLMALAQLLGLKTIAWGQGIGPLNRPFTRWLTKKVLQKLLSQKADKKGRVKMTPQERNQLMARLSNQSSQEYVQTKDIKEMNEQERIAHKEMCRKKIREKLNSMSQARSGKNSYQNKNSNQNKNLSSALNNINQMVSGLNSNPNINESGSTQDISQLLQGLGGNTDISQLLSKKLSIIT
jgi:hypothetical protein